MTPEGYFFEKRRSNGDIRRPSKISPDEWEDLTSSDSRDRFNNAWNAISEREEASNSIILNENVRENIYDIRSNTFGENDPINEREGETNTLKAEHVSFGQAVVNFVHHLHLRPHAK